jgi:molybdenum cofactor synthesis domain-containing protein
MDGYALRAEDVVHCPAQLEVIGSLMAGDDPGSVTVGPGQAVRIMTGAGLPLGADAVCMVERTSLRGGSVVIEEPVEVGTNVRAAGSDIASGDEVFRAGERLGPSHIGVLASLGAASVRAYRRPRVGVVSTGDELVSGPGPLAPGQIRDSNRPALVAQLQADGFLPVDLGHAGDQPDALATLLLEAANQCDAVITSGGVSVGDLDVVRLVLDQLGGRYTRWLQVAVKPAKPFAFSTLPPSFRPVFGLPGNPVSALVSYELFARPALRLMAGHPDLMRPRLVAVAAVDLPRQADGKLHLVRAVVSGEAEGWSVKPSGRQGSHQLRALAAANALVLLPDGPGAARGDKVEVWALDVDRLWPPATL